jgi:hypothetical protein
MEQSCRFRAYTYVDMDVWAVHLSAEFKAWMKVNHPDIIINYVLGGTTSKEG